MRAAAGLARYLLWNKLGLAFGTLFAILVAGRNLRLGAQDRLYVIATRAGLSGVLAQSQPPR